MKKTLSLLLVAAMLVCMMLSLVACAKNPIPEGNYAHKYDLFGMEMEQKGIISKDHFYRGYVDLDDDYVVYEDYTYELNEEKNEITVLFVGYKFMGENEAEGARMVVQCEEKYEMNLVVGLLATKDEAKTHFFELGEDYFIIGDEKYELQK